MLKIVERLFGNYSAKELKRIGPVIERIEGLGPETARLTDGEMRARTEAYKKAVAEGAALDSVMPEAYALVREAAKRVIGQWAAKVQVIGGIVLHQGRIAEMKTGEGKTLTAVFPLYLNALEGKGAHLVTVNDYLAKFHGEWMGMIYGFLGLTTGLILHPMEGGERRRSYACDITYGTNNEYGFDYLRDNMVRQKGDMVQRDLHYAIVDEVDSILIDEARTPLIISGQGEKSTDLYKKVNAFASRLKAKVVSQTDDKKLDEEGDEDYVVDEKANAASLTAKGMRKAEQHFGVDNLTDMDNVSLAHHINQAVKAHGTMRRDVDYVVKDGEIIIVDEFTGRLMYGRRYSDGLHQAIEAKEGVKVERENKTLATITFQNYFRMYRKLAGMTGTALTEENEFRSIYSLDVVAIPTNRPMVREDRPDMVFKGERHKFLAVVEDIAETHKTGQPILVGTISIEKSEALSDMLRKRGIKHQVLNAKFHEREAEIIAQAGKPDTVTIATNMAGRGTDIILGGNPEFLARVEMKRQGYDEATVYEAMSLKEGGDEALLAAKSAYKGLLEGFRAETEAEREKVVGLGGLYIIGTERHESRRIDNQLRGRSGRQGDPGASRFYISLEDELMRLFGADRILGMMNMLGMPDDQPIEHKMLTNSIENAQKKVEGRNFETRKHVLNYDDVMNKQREVIYRQRRLVLDGGNLRETFERMVAGVTSDGVRYYTAGNEYTENWDVKAMDLHFSTLFTMPGEVAGMVGEDEDISREEMEERLQRLSMERYADKEAEFGEAVMRDAERVILLRCVDGKWMDHIDSMDQLRQGISMRAYGQRDPVVEYKKEGFDMFEEMNAAIKEEAVKYIYHFRLAGQGGDSRAQGGRAPAGAAPRDSGAPSARTSGRPPAMAASDLRAKGAGPGKGAAGPGKDGGGQVRGEASRAKVGRNDPCPCGSGKKHKLCCGG